MLRQFLPDFIDKAFFHDLVASLLLLIFLIIVRAVLRSAILRREDLPVDTRRRWLISVRNTILLVMMLGLALIWSNEIEAVAVSMVAIAAAIVIANKELILCMLGSIYRTSTHAYSAGDRIEIRGLRGQVLDTSLLATTLLESSQANQAKGTVGRTITIPNSVLLSEPVYNETKLGSYVIHTIHVELGRGEDWQRAERVLLDAASAIVAGYQNELEAHRREIEQSFALESPSLSPRVRIALGDHETISLHLQLPVALGERSRTEQQILRLYLAGAATNSATGTEKS
ncbi:mechanosensitive ion channel family protein [Chitinilyticum piscinae]|uniref:Mechanosensitive ion channel family protein n=1 Tax=Chitinilyticum piscinae TaxID=2866724 RepID=A0A8J7FMU4_9NEIS|nr:mechanosensitive ion channel family protein [Chitinilyticum piscinae]MBE9609466.1 mechanosensitive ion channel family protein [Chitinilyticum piscinae]